MRLGNCARRCLDIAVPFWGLYIALFFLSPFIHIKKANAVTDSATPITVVYCKDCVPFQFTNKTGQPDGIILDFWKQWSQRTGTPVIYKPAGWEETIALVRDGKAEAHAGLFFNEYRDQFLEYGTKLINTSTSVFFHDSIAIPDDVSDIKAFRIGVISGDMVESFLQEKLSDAAVVGFPDYEKLIDALRSGDLMVFAADTPTGLYHLVQNDLLSDFHYDANKPLYQSAWHLASAEGRTDLVHRINQGMKKINQAEREKINRKWAVASDKNGKTRADVEITEKEKAWIENRKAPVLIGAETDWPPFDFVEDEKATGYSNDLMRLVAKKVGLKVKFVHGLTWAELLKQFNNKKIDILPALYKTPERERAFAMTSSYAANPSVLVAHEKASGLRNLEDLAGKKLAVVEGFSITRLIMEKHPAINPHPVENVLEGLKAVSLKKVDAFIGSLGVISYLLSENVIPFLSIVDEVVLDKPEATHLHMATLKDQVLLRDIVQKGLDAISADEKQSLRLRWLPFKFKEKDDASVLGLSEKEKNWLSQHPSIRLGIDPSWPPFEFLDSGGKYSGVSSGMVDFLSKRLGIDMTPATGLTWSQVVEKMKQGDLDVLPAVVPDEQRKQYMAFSKPYASFPVIIATHQDMPFVSDLSELLQHRVGVVKDYFIVDQLRTDYPDLKLVYFESTSEALRKLESGLVDAFIGNLITVGDEIRRLSLVGIKIASVTQYEMELCFGVRKDWPEFVEILNKTLNKITAQEKSAVVNAWLKPQEIRIGIDYKSILLWAVPSAVGIGLILSFIIAWNRRMAKEVVQRQAAEERFQTMAANVPGAIFQMQAFPDGRRKYLYMSERAEDFFEASPEAVVGEGRLLNFHPDDRAYIEADMKQAFFEKSALNIVGRITLPSENTKWVRLNAFPSKASDGELIYNGFILDITERKMAEMEIYAGERKVKAMSQAVEDAFVMIDAQGKVTFWNPAAERLFGYDESEAMGRDFHAMCAPDEYRNKITTGLKRFAQTGEGSVLGVTTEITALNRKGDRFPAEVTLSSFQLDDEWFAVGTVRDISERKLAEAQLHESQSRLDTALTASNTGLWDWRPLACEDYHNDQWYAQLGYTRSDFPKDANILMELMHPDDAVSFEENMEAYLSSGQDNYRQEFRMKAKDKSWKWILSVGKVTERDELGRVERLTGVHLDVTESKMAEKTIRDSEERSRMILESAGEGIFGIDAKGQMSFVNPAASEMLGFPVEELLGENVHDLIHHHRPDGSDYPVEECPMYASRTEGTVTHVENEVLWRKDGSSFPVEYASTPIFKQGQVVGTVVTFRDISERLKAELELREHLEELKQFNRVTTDRELMMIQLKEEINALLVDRGEEEKYKIV